jgi:hypothetical protein
MTFPYVNEQHKRTQHLTVCLTVCRIISRSASTDMLRQSTPSGASLQILKASSHIPRRLPCRADAVPLPRRAAKGLYCLSHLIYTVRPYLNHTCHAASVPCHDHAVLQETSQGHGTARHGNGHGMCELASPVQRRHVGDLPAFGFFRLPRGVPRRLLSEAYQSVKL